MVPTEEVDRWTDAPPETLAKVMEVARRIGAVQVDVFGAARAGLIVAGYEINHLHVHVWPSSSMADFDFGHRGPNPDPAAGRQRGESSAQGLRDAGLRRVRPGGEPG